MTTHKKTEQSLILASSSPYRRKLLSKLGLDFNCVSPNIDESPMPDEKPKQLVARLALEKAQAVASIQQGGLIIASDQVAVLDDKIITKPLNHENAFRQLRKASGRSLMFLTSLCLYNDNNNQYQLKVEPFVVNFLPLTDEQIENYLLKEKPYNCAGSFKSEGLGITLFAKLSGNDPNSLIGLPLIELTAMLRTEGIEPLGKNQQNCNT